MSTAPDNTSVGSGLSATKVCANSLQGYQTAFAGYVRNPRQENLPQGIAGDRMQLYRELMFNNFRSFLDACFPVSQRMLGKRRWSALLRRFFAIHPCSTPYFREIPAEFVAWLFSDQRKPSRNEPAFLPYLAHYEWLELVADTFADEPALPPLSAWDGVEQAVPMLEPSLQLACYPYPVQRIGPDWQPQQMETTWLMVWRNQENQVRFAEINQATFALLQILQAQPLSHSELLQQLPLIGIEGASLPQLMELLAGLADLGVILGVRA